jgi:hypothetical protein
MVKKVQLFALKKWLVSSILSQFWPEFDVTTFVKAEIYL